MTGLEKSIDLSTLIEYMKKRKHKFDKHIKASKSDYAIGYEEGWRNAMQDLYEIVTGRIDQI